MVSYAVWANRTIGSVKTFSMWTRWNCIFNLPSAKRPLRILLLVFMIVFKSVLFFVLCALFFFLVFSLILSFLSSIPSFLVIIPLIFPLSIGLILVPSLLDKVFSFWLFPHQKQCIFFNSFFWAWRNVFFFFLEISYSYLQLVYFFVFTDLVTNLFSFRWWNYCWEPLFLNFFKIR